MRGVRAASPAFSRLCRRSSEAHALQIRRAPDASHPLQWVTHTWLVPLPAR